MINDITVDIKTLLDGDLIYGIIKLFSSLGIASLNVLIILSIETEKYEAKRPIKLKTGKIDKTIKKARLAGKYTNSGFDIIFIKTLIMNILLNIVNNKNVERMKIWKFYKKYV